ncbi:MAG: sxtJ [Candidatus Omnitrophica bacterium]|nr:sxtJ [Candidatus Omnitrophota bacterium]
MIIEDFKAIRSAPRDLRKFGMTMGIFFGLVGSFLVWKRHESAALYLFIAAGVFLVAGLVFPRALWPIHKFWMGLALVMGWVMTRVILSVVFYVVLTPIGFFVRLSGKDFMNRTIEPEKESYWSLRQKSPADKPSYENQF